MGILLGGVVVGFVVAMNFCEIFGFPPEADKFLGWMPIILFPIIAGWFGWLIAKIIGWFPDKMYKLAREIKMIPFGNAGDDKKFFLDIGYNDKNVTYYVDKKIWASEHQFIPYDKAIIREGEGPGCLLLFERRFVKPVYHLIAFVSEKNKLQYSFLIPQGSIRRFTFKL